jgi:Ca2+-binding RTX toxin-like protein
MSATIDFTGVAGSYTDHAEDGFYLAATPTLTGPFVGGQPGGNLGTGEYFQAFWTSQDNVLTRVGGGTFGIVDLQIEGFRFNGFDALGNPVPDAVVTTITFTGVTAAGQVTHTFVSDGLVGLETVALPSDFVGLQELHWQATGGAGLILFDDIRVFENRAPVAADFDDAIAADGTYFGVLAASDPDGQVLTYEVVGALPAGVGLDTDGGLYLLPTDDDLDLLIGQHRTVTFDYRAGDGEAWSATRQVTLRIEGVNDGGQVYAGGAGDDWLVGLYGPDTLIGEDGADYLEGGRGADSLSGGLGADMLDGGAGNDALDTGGGEDVAFGGDGDDTLTGGGPDYAYLAGGAGDDVLVGGGGPTDLLGDEGDDVLTAGAGDTAFVGGAGDDTLTAGSGADLFIYAGPVDHGDDRIVRFDVLQDQLFAPGLHADAAATLAAMQQVGLDVVLSYTDEDLASHEITLVGVSLLDLDLGNILA